MSSASEARVSVVVLTHNRVFELERTVYQLRRMPERPRIIVVDNGSDDAATVKRITRFPEVTLVRSEVNLGAAGRNLGVAVTETPYVAFCDDDTWWEPGSLALSCELFDAHPQLGVINARVLIGVHEKEDKACQRMERSPLNGIGWPGPPLISFMAGAVAMRTQAYRSVGGYQPRLFLGAEEALMALDLASKGWQMAYVRDVIVHHYPSGCRDQARRKVILARNRLWIAALRLPLSDLWREVKVILAEAWREGRAMVVVTHALQGLTWVIRNRRVVPGRVSDMHRMVFAGGGRRADCSTTASEVSQSGA